MTKQQGRQVATLPSRHRRSALRRLFPLESIGTVCYQLVKPRGVFMTIKIPCSCGTMLSADEKLAGKRVRCPRCKNEFKVPFPEVQPADEPATVAEAAPRSPARPGARPTSPPPPKTAPDVPPPPRAAGTLNHDHPLVRYERLLTITGGRPPRQHLRLRKALLTP